MIGITPSRICLADQVLDDLAQRLPEFAGRTRSTASTGVTAA
jgi:hypothetical protein